MVSGTLAVCMLGCGDGDGGSQAPDGSVLPPEGIPACATRIGFAAENVSSLGIDGADAIVATAARLLAVPLDGSPQTTLVPSAATIVTSIAGVAYYAIVNDAVVANPVVEFRTRDGNVHATIAAPALPRALAVDATNIYAIARDATATKLWRIPRTANAQAIAIATLPESARELAIGTSVAAFSTGQTLFTVPIPAGGTPVEVGPAVAQTSRLLVVSDAGFEITNQKLTSQTDQIRIDRFLPTAKAVHSATLTSEQAIAFGDDKYIYVATRSRPGAEVASASMMVFDAASSTRANVSTCADLQGSSFAYDATKLYGAQLTTAGMAELYIAPRAP